MRDKLHDYLLQRPAGATPGELLDLIFTQPGRDPELGPRLLQTLLGPDERFVWRESDGTWSLRRHDALARPLSETTFVVVDLETTGTGVSPHGIIEIGAARVENGRIVAEMQQLVRPAGQLPSFITRLTGITVEMLVDQPPIHEVWPRFVEMIGQDVLVAHNAAYDLGYLNATALSFDGRPLPNLHLCTLKLARRLLPEQKRRGLDALAGLFGIPQTDRHRALGDARITVEILFHLMERLHSRGITQLDQLLDLQQQARDGRRFFCPLPRDKVDQLPETPGIYRFFDDTGRLLYIGKAKRLRRRVGSYLSNAGEHSRKTLDLIRHIHDVRAETLGSELEAALTEATAIRREKPPYNRLGKHLPRIAFLKLTLADPFPRLQLTRRLSGGRARYLGPWRSADEAQRVVKLLVHHFKLRTCRGRLHPDASFTPCFQGQIGDCSLPCTAGVHAEAYHRQVQKVLRLFEGETQTLEAQLHHQRDAHAQAMRFEAAARTQRDIELVQRIAQRQRTLGWVTTKQNFLILQPSLDRRLVLAYGVAGGRLTARARLASVAELDPFTEVLAQALSERELRKGMRPEDVDGTVILAAWLRDRGPLDGFVFPLQPPAEKKWPATQQAEWRAACQSLLGGPTGEQRAAAQHPRGYRPS
jgi:DNA polymerase-3 subunit epsilon